MNDLATLFARDPLELTDDDISGMIAEFRKQRAQFVAAGQKAPTKVKKETVPLDLDKLDL